MRRKRALSFANVLPKSTKILTVCNINGELVYLYYALRSIGKEVMFYVSETRPYLQGSRLTFWELKMEGASCILLCDNQAASLMRNKEVDIVVSGSDRANKKGDIINKIGTYALARLASLYGIPFYAYTQYPKDIDIKDIKVEERDPQELFMFLDIPNNIVKEFDGIYPGFDITPSEFISGYITQEGFRENEVK